MKIPPATIGPSSSPARTKTQATHAMPPDGYRVGVVGATGAVGSTMLELLASRAFPAAEVVPFASERSAGTKLRFGADELECRTLDEDSIAGLDLALSSAGGVVSAEWTPR